MGKSFIDRVSELISSAESLHSDTTELCARIIKAKLPVEQQNIVCKELESIISLSPGNSEYYTTKKYIDTVISIPYGEFKRPYSDIKRIHQSLKNKVYLHPGLERKLIECAATYIHAPKCKKVGLLFIGVPGVGKTKTATAFIESLGISFGGVIPMAGSSNAFKLSGVKRFFTNAAQGEIIDRIIQQKSMNIGLVLDEIDKIVEHTEHGSAFDSITQAVDTTQNTNYIDEFLDFSVDISNITFIATANYIDKIPPHVLDRFEIIEIPAYSEEVKVQIAVNYLIPEKNKEFNVNLFFENEAILYILKNHINDNGMRGLSKYLDNIYKKYITQITYGKLKVDNHNLFIIDECILKRIYPDNNIIIKTKKVFAKYHQLGCVYGMAYSAPGVGKITEFQAEKLSGISGKITGNAGVLLQESINVALTYIKVNASIFKINHKILNNSGFHIHLPGSNPKDGYSAGAALSLAIISVLSGSNLPTDLAVTGEVDLKGNIKPVGGIAEKVQAASDFGIKNIILPMENKIDIEKLGPKITKSLNIIFIDNIAELYSKVIEIISGYKTGNSHVCQIAI